MLKTVHILEVEINISYLLEEKLPLFEVINSNIEHFCILSS